MKRLRPVHVATDDDCDRQHSQYGVYADACPHEPPRDAGRIKFDVSAPLRPELVTWPGVVERFDRSLVASLDAGDAMVVAQL
jgi:hypothetical protein